MPDPTHSLPGAYPGNHSIAALNMKDGTGKWISTKDLIQILKKLPTNTRIYPNQVGNLNVIDADKWMNYIGFIDFIRGTYEDDSDEDDSDA